MNKKVILWGGALAFGLALNGIQGVNAHEINKTESVTTVYHSEFEERINAIKADIHNISDGKQLHAVVIETLEVTNKILEYIHDRDTADVASAWMREILILDILLGKKENEYTQEYGNVLRAQQAQYVAIIRKREKLLDKLFEKEFYGSKKLQKVFFVEPQHSSEAQ